MSLQLLTANRLIDGEVVYLTAAGGWETRIETARLAAAADEAAALAAIGAQAVAERVVVGPYLIDVERDGDAIVPLRYRERIRAYGPSNRPDLAKQAAAG